MLYEEYHRRVATDADERKRERERRIHLEQDEQHRRKQGVEGRDTDPYSESSALRSVLETAALRHRDHTCTQLAGPVDGMRFVGVRLRGLERRFGAR